MAKIKICGLTRQQDIDIVNAALPDYIGFVFAKSRRQIDGKSAKMLKERLSPRIKAVGVFVNEKIENIIRLCSQEVIDMIQLHGDESEDYIKELKEHVRNEIIKAVRIRENDDLKKAAQFSCDYLLFDAYDEKEYGGTGKTFDWSVIKDINRPFFLAGGINSENVFYAVKYYNPYCIDVSSSVETNGYKDPEKVMEIIAAVRSLKR